MKTAATALLLAVFICHITLISSFTSSPTCNHEQFGNQSYFYEYYTHTYYFAGRPEVCTSVGSTPVCRDSLTQTFMERFCQYIQSNSSQI
jgi:hypothetical protein